MINDLIMRLSECTSSLIRSDRTTPSEETFVANFNVWVFLAVNSLSLVITVILLSSLVHIHARYVKATAHVLDGCTLRVQDELNEILALEHLSHA